MSTQVAQRQSLSPLKPHAIFGGLSKREHLFVEYYLADPNGDASKAARLAGFNHSTPESLWATASRLLRRGRVQAEIKRRLGLHIASADEVLERLTKHSRADLAQVLNDDGTFNLKTAKKRGNSDLLKKLKVKKRIEYDAEGNKTEHIEHELELHDAQAATTTLARYHGLLMDRSESVNLSLNVEVQPELIPEVLAAWKQRKEQLAASRSQLSESASPSSEVAETPINTDE